MATKVGGLTPSPLTIVIKLGSSSILHPEPPYFPQIATLSALVETCLELRSLGHRVVIVSSGAIGMGLHRMELPALAGGKKRPIGEQQALAAIGQGRLIALWDQLFGMLKQPIAQILMTRNDIADRSRYLNATTTLSTLLSLGVIPIINENDTISVSEILHINKFGDNDTLSAIAAGMCGADYLFLLTDVEGLYEDNPRKVAGARLVSKVRDIEEVRKMVSTSTLGSSLGTGGMETKLIAAELATAAGCATVITLGSDPSRILTIVQNHSPLSSLASTSSLPSVEFITPNSSSSGSVPPFTLPLHTLFTPKPRPLTSRRFWILHGLTPRGTIYIDEGAYRAISRGERDGGGGGNGGRLLAAGVLRVEGRFAAGQAVRVCVIRGRWGKQQVERGSKVDGTASEQASRPGSPDHWEDRLKGSKAEGDGRGERGERLVESVEDLRRNENGRIPEGEEVKLGDEEEEEVLEFGRGLTNYNSLEIDRVKGLRRTVAGWGRTSVRVVKQAGFSCMVRLGDGLTIISGDSSIQPCAPLLSDAHFHSVPHLINAPPPSPCGRSLLPVLLLQGRWTPSMGTSNSSASSLPSDFATIASVVSAALTAPTTSASITKKKKKHTSSTSVQEATSLTEVSTDPFATDSNRFQLPTDTITAFLLNTTRIVAPAALLTLSPTSSAPLALLTLSSTSTASPTSPTSPPATAPPSSIIPFSNSLSSSTAGNQTVVGTAGQGPTPVQRGLIIGFTTFSALLIILLLYWLLLGRKSKSRIVHNVNAASGLPSHYFSAPANLTRIGRRNSEGFFEPSVNSIYSSHSKGTMEHLDEAHEFKKENEKSHFST